MNSFSLDGSTVLVTGGTRGIGRAISCQLARAGATVIANYARNDAGAESLRADAVAQALRIETLRADLTTPKGLAAVHERLQEEGTGTISIVHSAATGVHKPFEELTTRHWDWTMSLNVRAFFELVRLVLPLLRDGSAIVALSSAGAARAVPAYTAVGSSKGALESLARHMAVELAPRGVRVNILSPGSVLTEAWEAFPDRERRISDAQAATPIGRLVTVDEIALAALYLCSPASRGVVGHTLVIDGGARVVD